MRHEEDDDDEAASVASVETRGTFVSDDGEFYDSYSKNVDDEQEIDEAIEELTEKRTTTRVAALEKLTAYLQQYLAPEDVSERLVPKFLALLDHKDVDVRSAAGENVAFLYESAQNCGVPLPYSEEILARFLEMSKDSSKKNSKKDRKTQRVVFRDIHSTLASGETPHVSFSVKSDVLEISSWKSVKQFEAMKECLQTGLQEHIKYNNILRAILDLPETLEDRKVDRVRHRSLDNSYTV
ncbi:Ubiquitin carboxyl-terminal hydrolase [Phytophthora nicotianae]|uniref:Ubiquitin carboxyl-terminal hydrolase n=1 Tax=Phytophthora nicotianae TaxID=4792 RepID=A0A0W8DS39_PHYNI|nr:Ubiquitin carboxyl-terminal hydrolase [Phytophthora nicotianae]